MLCDRASEKEEPEPELEENDPEENENKEENDKERPWYKQGKGQFKNQLRRPWRENNIHNYTA